jgi:HEAT repeat protein
MAGDSRSIRRSLEEQRMPAAEAVALLADAARVAPTLPSRLDACSLLGSIAGRAFDATWKVAEQAAFALLELARDADAPAERAGLLVAMGRGFRNLWLMPYVHRRISDDDDSVAAAALCAAGGLAFPALEEAITSRFLGDDVRPELRLAAIGALGRMGAESAASRLVPYVQKEPIEAAAALAALTEIRSRAGESAALEVLAEGPPRDVLVSAIRYLAEIGQPEVLGTLRRLARDEDPELRIAAGLASRAFKAERGTSADERILSALTERDRAVRAALARRLRTLPVSDVLTQAELLLSDDPEGVIQIIAEVRAPEVTRLLLRLAADDSLAVGIRARAIGSVEADETWERDALMALVGAPCPTAVRVAAAQTLGAFAPLGLVLDHLSANFEDPEPTLRAALLWALQLAARPSELAGAERARAETLVRRALEDADPDVRRRAAYVAGNLEAAALVPDLVKLAQGEPERADLRVAAFVGLSEIGSPARFTDLVHLWNREEDPRALGAASRAIERSVLSDAPPPSKGPVSAPPSLARVHDRLKKLLASADPTIRAAAARVAGLSPGATPASTLAAMTDDAAPRAREQAVIALGRLGAPEHAGVLAHALDDADPAIQERAAEALLSLDSAESTARVLDFASRTSDRGAALRVAQRITLPRGDTDAVLAALGTAIARVSHDDPIYEPLLALKVAALEASRPAKATGASVDASITELFPTWPRLAAARGFEPLGKSLRTAEMLYASVARGGDADYSAAIVLWMKSLEGYLHAWLGPRLRSLQLQPQALWELAEHLAWPTYQRWLGDRWADPVAVGELSVEVPLRSVVGVLREFQQRRLKSVDSPASVTEWSRLMLFLATDHPAGARNVLKVGSREAERTVRLAHHLHVLAQVRNAVTHRQVAAASTLDAFRRSYYAAFEDLTSMA